MKSISTYISDKGFIKKAQKVLIVLFLLLIAIDIYLAVSDSKTISNVIKEYTDNGLFVLTYFWGALVANLFITTLKKRVDGTIGSIIVIGIALIMVLFNIEPKVSSFLANNEFNISIYSISMIAGFLIGLLFWRQKHTKPENA